MINFLQFFYRLGQLIFLRLALLKCRLGYRYLAFKCARIKKSFQKIEKAHGIGLASANVISPTFVGVNVLLDMAGNLASRANRLIHLVHLVR